MRPNYFYGTRGYSHGAPSSRVVNKKGRRMRMRILLTILGMVFAIPLPAQSQDRFVSKLTLPKGETIVVAEGDFEARSTDSFSIRLYEAAVPPDETTFTRRRESESYQRHGGVLGSQRATGQLSERRPPAFISHPAR
jgi:hypothetical protein